MPLKPFFRKFDGWWYVQLRTGSKRFAKKLVKGKENQQEAYRLFNQLMAENAPLPPQTRLRVHDILTAFLKQSAETNDPATFEWYKHFLVNFDHLYGTLKPYQVTPEIVEAWINTNKGWKGSRRGAIIAIKRVFNWAFENDKISKNNIRRMKQPPAKARDRFLTPEERRTIFDNYPDNDSFRDFLFALNNTACRPGEISAVTAAHVDLRTGVWRFNVHKTDETGEPRVVVLTPEMVELTKRLIKEYPEGPLFRNEDGNAWTTNSIRCRFRRVREKLGLGPDLVAYLYRHATATDMLEAGTGVAQVAEILGHKSVDMVMRHYSKIRQRHDHLREQIMNARKRA